MSLRHYLQLLRLPNAFTAVTNVFTGCAAAGWPDVGEGTVLLLALSSATLYSGGIALNDYCDLDVDRMERPRRPLPSGAVRPVVAMSIAAFLFVIGISAAAMVNSLAAVAASALVLLIVTYDTGMKNVPVAGALNMGACRFGNVLLGACAAPAASMRALPFAVVIAAWVVALSFVSRREVEKPHLQSVVKTMVLLIPVIDGVFVGVLTTPWLGLGVALFALPAWLLARWLYVT